MHNLYNIDMYVLNNFNNRMMIHLFMENICHQIKL